MANSNRLAKSYLGDLSKGSDELFEVGFEPFIRYISANAPLASKIGYSISPKYDVARFGQQPLLHFFPAAFHNVKFSESIGEYKIKNSYFGMLGINGPLPIHLTEHAIERLSRYKDKTFSEFLDIFNHRFLSLFYRAWADAQPAVCHDRPEDDHFIKRLNALSGKSPQPDTTDTKKNQYIHEYLSGLLSQKNRSGKTLIQIISSRLGLKINLREFVGKWYDTPAQEHSRTGQNNNALGLTATLGERVYLRLYNFCIQIGPVSYDEYMNLLNDKQKIKDIENLTRTFSGNECEFTIEIYLKEQQTRPCVLGAGKLGLTSWSQNPKGHLQQTKTVLVYTKEC